MNNAELLARILDAVAGTVMRDGKPLETMMDAGDCERIAKSVFAFVAFVKPDHNHTHSKE